MATPYLAEIKVVSFNFAPKGWAFCNGQTLPINQNQALFSLLGITYGGDGIRTFQLPNLQARMPIHQGTNYPIGSLGGESSHTLILTEMAAHNHGAVGVSTNASTDVATGNIWAASSHNPYAASPNTTLIPTTLGQTGGGQPHDNMTPYLVLNFIIALQGIFPSRN
jgi:microcystin-dependent protein